MLIVLLLHNFKQSGWVGIVTPNALQFVQPVQDDGPSLANSNLFKGEVASISDKGKVTKAKCLRSPIYCGGSRTLVCPMLSLYVCFKIIYILIKI